MLILYDSFFLCLAVVDPSAMLMYTSMNHKG